MTELSPGRILASRFELRRLLGRGGMGQVWLAVDSELGEQVAVSGGLSASDAVVTSGSAALYTEFLKSRLGAGCAHD